ncbi:hypothetical protein CES86_0470 [Brucella lupini]|uniref:Uncharacterized protein n=1 Tax=Brucella lupini TaxID=255457 RepID=A0A256GY17_9HYPH|nr:hypothetical protein CES86_0470 [Brucella lupini]
MFGSRKFKHKGKMSAALIATRLSLSLLQSDPVLNSLPSFCNAIRGSVLPSCNTLQSHD